MDAHRGIVSIVSPALLLLTSAATGFIPAASHPAPLATGEPEACTFLSAADAAKSLEVSGTTGKRLVAASPRGCVWSNDPDASDSSRRVVLVFHAPAAFQAAMHTVITTIKIEPASGLGDNAFYQLFPADSPMLWVLKGNTAFSLRIMTRVKTAPFSVEQEKSKEAGLAKSVLAKP